jgi:gamma-butyrobetaine dioxygenase
MDAIRIVDGPSGPQLLLKSASAERPLPALWLRPRSYDESQRDAVTGQRLVNPHRLPEDLRLTAARWSGALLHLSFSDDFSGLFDPTELAAGATLSDGCPPPRPWRSEEKPDPRYDWTELQHEEVMHRALRDFIELGFLLVDNTPTERESILQIARHFGYVRDTNFGAYFEVYSRPVAIDLAYQPVALGPHTDNPYRAPVPGIQLLQCLRNETDGGLSTLADSLAVAEQVRDENPQGFALLARVPLRFEHRDADTHLVSIKPMIELDGSGNMVGVHYSPRLEDIPLMSESDTRSYQRARSRMGELFSDPRYELRFKLMPGQMMMFDNNRVLHGRTAFDPAQGHRQLQGCYIDRDGVRSRFLVLERKHGRGAQSPSDRAAKVAQS